MRGRASSVLSIVAVVGILLAGPALGSAAGLVKLQAGGEIRDAVVVGDIAYLAAGASISVWQLSSDGATAPTHVATTEPLPGLVRGLAVSGDTLFATWATPAPYGELAVLSLADPLNPLHQLDFQYSTSSFLRPAGLVAIGDVLLMTDPESGLWVLDVSDPLAPSVTSTMFAAPSDQLVLNGSYVVGMGAGFSGFLVEVLDVTVPSAPTSVGFYSSFGNYASAAVDGDLLVLIGDGFEVVSLANPAMPAWMATVPSSGAYVHGGLVRGDLAYLGDDDGIQVWDLSDPTNPAAGALVSAPADRTKIGATHPVTGGTEALLFTETGRGLALDLSTPATPTLEHTFDLPVGSDPWDVAELADGSLAVADFYSGLRIADDALASLGRVDPGIAMGGYENVTVAGTTAYVASWGYGLLTMDVADSGAPSSLGSVEIPYASAVDVVGDVAFVVTSTNGGVFQAVGVTDPALPALRGMLGISHGWDVVAHDGMALVADQTNGGTGLKVIDVANPDAPFELGSYTACDSARGVAADGDLAFLACADGSLHVVSIADPALPTQVGVYSDPGTYMPGTAVAVSGSIAWFGSDIGIDLVDVSDPTLPVLHRRVELPGAVRGIFLDEDGNGWAAAGLAGVYRIERVMLADGFESGGFDAWSGVVQ